MALRGETLPLAQGLSWRRGLISFQGIMSPWPGDFFLTRNHAPIPGLPGCWSWCLRNTASQPSPLLSPLPWWLVGWLKAGFYSVAEAGPLSNPSTLALQTWSSTVSCRLLYRLWVLIPPRPLNTYLVTFTILSPTFIFYVLLLSVCQVRLM